MAISQSIHREEYAPGIIIVVMFFCESALEAQRDGTLADANKSESKTSGSLLRARRATADARR